MKAEHNSIRSGSAMVVFLGVIGFIGSWILVLAYQLLGKAWISNSLCNYILCRIE